MRLSDAGSRRRQTKVLYTNHHLPPWLTEDATRDGSAQLLGAKTCALPWLNQPWYRRKQRVAQWHTDCAPLLAQHPTPD
jgi:hypothetical protein